MFIKLKSRFTMKPTGESFTDIVTWDIVKYWVYCYNQKWTAVSKWGFRVKID